MTTSLILKRRRSMSRKLSEVISRTKQTVGDKAESLIFGDMLSSQFFARNKFTIIVVVGLIMLNITIKYECQTHMESINKLERDLAIVKSESIRERSTYKSRTRESTMQQSIDSLRLGLSVKEQPPYVVRYRDNDKKSE